jgi:hypothetical protein
MSEFNFKAHLIDLDLPEGFYGQTALMDLDNDGRLEFVIGQQYGNIFFYKYHSPDYWTRYMLGTNSPSDVGVCAFDVDGDGYMDLVTGGAWYRNPGNLDRVFERIAFDPDLKGVHDVKSADLDGDGKLEVVTMSDQNNLRWYKIPDDPRNPWVKVDVGKGVHAGVALGDLDGNGNLDIVRTNVWFENASGNGLAWVEHPIGPNTPPPPDFQPYFAFDATKAVVCDMNRNGVRDIVFCDAEIPGGAVWWMENLNGKGTAWKRHEIFSPPKGPRRGAFHSLHVGDLDGDGDLDIFSCEMEYVGGEEPPRYYIWENVDGSGVKWREHVILDENLGGHEAVVGDITGNGLPDILSKPWHQVPNNGAGGKMFVLFLENLGE